MNWHEVVASDVLPGRDILQEIGKDAIRGRIKSVEFIPEGTIFHLEWVYTWSCATSPPWVLSLDESRVIALPFIFPETPILQSPHKEIEFGTYDEEGDPIFVVTILDRNNRLPVPR
jgi:hypothetical protein